MQSATEATVQTQYHVQYAGDLVVELEFVDGPLQGRRITALATTDDLGFAGFSDAGAPLLGYAGNDRAPLGIYRFERTYDCVTTGERVYRFRWRPATDAAPRSAAATRC